MTSHLVVQLDRAGNGLGKGETGSLGLVAFQLVPDISGDVVGSQAVGRPKRWKVGFISLSEITMSLNYDLSSDI